MTGIGIDSKGFAQGLDSQFRLLGLKANLCHEFVAFDLGGNRLDSFFGRLDSRRPLFLPNLQSRNLLQVLLTFASIEVGELAKGQDGLLDIAKPLGNLG